ncbi:MAG: cobalamin biosynthesis protein CobW [Rhodospirillales bacterium]
MRIPATVVTGFLGAGKTSLIRHLIANAGGARLAILINEFGDRGIDRELLLGCGDAGCRDEDIVELANGCICCTVADEFLPTMERLLARNPAPDHILIETSGLALPKPLVQAFNWPDIRARLTVDGVITVVDAPAIADGRFADDPVRIAREMAEAGPMDHESPIAELFEDQLACADLVVLNKTDLVDAETLAGVRTKLATAMTAGVKVVTTTQGGLDPRVALGLAAAAEAGIEQRRCHHDDPEEGHDHDEFESVVAAFGSIGDPAAFEQRLRRLAGEHDVLRIKGFLDVADKPRRHVLQAVGSRVERYYDRAWQPDEERRSELIVIGLKGFDAAAVVRGLAD